MTTDSPFDPTPEEALQFAHRVYRSSDPLQAFRDVFYDSPDTHALRRESLRMLALPAVQSALTALRRYDVEVLTLQFQFDRLQAMSECENIRRLALANGPDSYTVALKAIELKARLSKLLDTDADKSAAPLVLNLNFSGDPHQQVRAAIDAVQLPELPVIDINPQKVH